MILINDFSRKFEFDLYSVCADSPYGARIISYHTAYHGKKYDFLDFWICRNDEGQVLCAFCKYYSSLIVCGKTEGTAKNEIEDFIKMLSPSSVLCDSGFDLNLDLYKSGKKFTEGDTMRCKKIQGEFDLKFDFQVTKIGSDINRLRRVYDLLVSENCKNRAVEALPDFESYFLDISHRIRHNTAEIYAVFDAGGRVVSTAAVVAKSNDSAVIGCVATAFDCRRNGMATRLVYDITKKQLEKGRGVYLHRERKIHLYSKIGFVVIGKWREYNSGTAYLNE